MSDKSVLLQYTVSNKVTSPEMPAVGGTSVLTIEKESASTDSSIVDDSDEPIKGIPFTFSRCGLSYTLDKTDEKLPASAPAIANFIYGAFSFGSGGGFLYILFENRDNHWREYYISTEGTTLFCPIVWESFSPEDTTPREPIKQGKTFIEFKEDDVVWIAYSETQWSRKQVLNMMADKSAIKKRFQKIDVADWLGNNPLSDNEQKKETKILDDIDNPGYYYTYGVTPTTNDNVMYSFALNDPFGAADDIADMLEKEHLILSGLIASLNNSHSVDFKYREMANKGFDVYKEYFEKHTAGENPDQYKALFDSALVLNNILFNEKLMKFADPEPKKEHIKLNIREDIKREKNDITEKDLSKEVDKAYEKMEDRYDDMKKYIKRISPDKIKKVLAYDAREKLRKKIEGLRESLATMLRSAYYQNALVDYYNNSDGYTIGQERCQSHLKILAKLPWEIELFIQPELADTENEWENFLKEALTMEETVPDQLGYLGVDEKVAQAAVHAKLISKVEVINALGDIERFSSLSSMVCSATIGYMELLTYVNRKSMMRLASENDIRHFEDNVRKACRKLRYSCKNYAKIDEFSAEDLTKAVELIRQTGGNIRETRKSNNGGKNKTKIVGTYDISNINRSNLEQTLEYKKMVKNSAQKQQFFDIMGQISDVMNICNTALVIATTLHKYFSDAEEFSMDDFKGLARICAEMRTTYLEGKSLDNTRISRRAYSKLGISKGRATWLLRKGLTVTKAFGIGMLVYDSLMMIWDGFTYMKNGNTTLGLANIAMGFIVLGVMVAGVAIMGAVFLVSAMFNIFALIVGIFMLIMNYLFSWDPFEQFLHNVVFSKRIEYPNIEQVSHYSYKKFLVDNRKTLALPYDRDELNYNKDKGKIDLSDFPEMYRWMINMMVNLSVRLRLPEKAKSYLPILNKWLNKTLNPEDKTYYYMAPHIIDLRYMDAIPDTRLELKMILYPRGFSGDKETCLAVAKEVELGAIRDFQPDFRYAFSAPTNIKGMAYKECEIDFKSKLIEIFDENEHDKSLLFGKCRYILYIRLISNDGVSVWPSDEKTNKYMAISERIIANESEYKATTMGGLYTYQAKTRYEGYNKAMQDGIGGFYINDQAVYYGTEEEICLQVAKEEDKDITPKELEKMEKELEKKRKEREKEAKKWKETLIIPEAEPTETNPILEEQRQIMGGK
ncbi:toxin VasX [Dysgonomonas sp. 25]|uniref:toxin VasX n=1 Tax=Dysgonomonas sp. 25 TaxID=2302933 RepID=UPI0013CFFAF3|nr:toxin VasX [Dysgonomonas sp. 25]NDV70009.1 hypothetical protein [Dysgonomonas sp. 25]